MKPTASPWAARRQRLMDLAGPETALIIPAACPTLRNMDVEHAFRQHSDFWWLTGFGEPEALLLLRPGTEEPCALFVRPRDAKAETWTGRRAGVEGAVRDHGADLAFPLDELGAKLPELLDGTRRLGYTWGLDGPMDAVVAAASRRHRLKPRDPFIGADETFDPRALLHEARLRKSADEIATLRLAAAVTVEAHHEAMRLCGPGMGERQVQAGVEYVFKAAGSARVGYESIVAAGDNATILHYTLNDGRIGSDDLVLIDAGAEVDYYTADITRTFPASGRFSPAQRDVYQVVLDAQRAAIDACTVGRTFRDPHDVAVRRLTEGMITLGLLAGEVDGLIESGAYKRYYMHRTGHWLGMDVHDVGAYFIDREPRALEAGMVTTVEPGLYISQADEEAPAGLRGIGVRIEDDILIAAAGPDNLTAACARSVDEVEAMCATAPRWVRPVSL